MKIGIAYIDHMILLCRVVLNVMMKEGLMNRLVRCGNWLSLIMVNC